MDAFDKPTNFTSHVQSLGNPYTASARFADKVDLYLYQLRDLHGAPKRADVDSRLCHLRHLNAYTLLSSYGIFDAERKLPALSEVNDYEASQVVLVANFEFYAFMNTLGQLNDNLTRAVAEIVGISNADFSRSTRKQVRDLVCKRAPHLRESFSKLEDAPLQKDINSLHNQIKHGVPAYQLCLMNFREPAGLRIGLFGQALSDMPLLLENLVHQFHGHTSLGILDVVTEVAKLPRP